MVENARMTRGQNGSLSVTSHELHNLIAVIIAEAQLLQLDHPADAPNFRSAVAIERAGRRLETLIDMLTAFRDTTRTPSKRSQGHTTPLDVDTGPRGAREEVVEGTEA